MKSISLRMDESEAAALERIAEVEGRSKSAVVREAMALYMARTESPSGTSVLEHVSDLVGCFEGPGDLTSNPKHMEGFGL